MVCQQFRMTSTQSPLSFLFINVRPYDLVLSCLYVRMRGCYCICNQIMFRFDPIFTNLPFIFILAFFSSQDLSCNYSSVSMTKIALF